MKQRMVADIDIGGLPQNWSPLK